MNDFDAPVGESDVGSNQFLDAEPEPVHIPVLHQPSDPVGEVVATNDALHLCVETLAAGHGAFAIDVERAGGYRYTQRAYLLQIRRQGAGTWLIDPLPFDNLAPLARVLADDEWVLHAASQDLPSLAELGLHGPALFDTELAGRLVGLPRVGLAAMTEHYLGYTLAKAHSAADWSARPLPADWLAYAALDVEPLLELRDHLRRDLADRGRQEWAQQEFDYVRNAQPAAPRAEPWRRVKGLSNRSPRALAIARELWIVRDETARNRDKAPSRVLPDAVIAALASAPPSSASQLRSLPSFRRQPDAQLRAWHAAVERAQLLPESQLPARRAAAEAVPNHRSWERINPLAAGRLQQVRDDLGRLAESLGIARENLVSPAVLREVVWEISGRDDPRDLTNPSEQVLAELLSKAGARPWQVSLVVQPMIAALAAADAAADATADAAASASASGADAQVEPTEDHG